MFEATYFNTCRQIHSPCFNTLFERHQLGETYCNTLFMWYYSQAFHNLHLQSYARYSLKISPSGVGFNPVTSWPSAIIQWTKAKRVHFLLASLAQNNVDRTIVQIWFSLKVSIYQNVQRKLWLVTKWRSKQNHGTFNINNYSHIQEILLQSLNHSIWKRCLTRQLQAL